MNKNQQCFYCGEKTEIAHNVCDICSYKYPEAAYRTIHYWKSLKPLFQDYECTGLSVGAQITECCIKSLDGTSLFFSRFNPNIEVEKKAEKMTGLNLDNLKEEPELSHHWSTLFSLINNRVLISWGTSLDERVLNDAAANFATPFDSSTLFLDLEPIYSRIRGEWSKGNGVYARTSLKYAAKLENIAVHNTHNAADDVDILMAIFKKLLRVDLPSHLEIKPYKKVPTELINNQFYALSALKGKCA